ncbi:hypothetical protein [Oscillibacter sp.]|uniref:hypothetical protein n=1 Tax=Oscillibacter sp. TaxID=1945593 RepID=UPI0033958AB9
MGSQKKFIYIHAGAGYGKTTLLSQLAVTAKKAVWLTLAGESDVFLFLETLCDSIRNSFQDYNFVASEYLPFAEQDNFITILSNAVIASIEKLGEPVTIILDDLHTVACQQIKELIADFLKYASKNIRLLMGSREPLWQELVPLYLKGKIFELTQNDLIFTRNEMYQLLGLEDDEIYRITEGWPLAAGSFRVLLENGVTPPDVPEKGKGTLYIYLFYECFRQMSSGTVDFLKTSACFEKLDPPMLDEVLGKKNTRLILESLVLRNIFTTKTADGYYRYHALFRDCLLEKSEPGQGRVLMDKAAQYYFRNSDYSKAAEYASKADDRDFLLKIILESHKEMIQAGRFSELRTWFQALGDIRNPGPEILVAKGTFLSAVGNFVAANECLDKAIPNLRPSEAELFMEAMVSKARVLRNFVSFEESDELLDKLIERLDEFASESAYAVVIEKLYNLCWEARTAEAMTLCQNAIEECARAGNLKMKAWYERFMSAIYFFTGDMRKSVFHYENSLKLSEDERSYLDLHSIGIYAAKSYQMLGNREKAVSLITDELQKLRITSKYEEIWSGYLFAAEIHYQNAFIDMMNGKDASYEATIRYFTLADEYAPLFRKSDFQLRWAKMLKLTYSLIFTSEPKEEIEKEIFENLDSVGDFFKTISLMRLSGYYGAIPDPAKAAKCAKMAVDVGERTGMYLYVALAYGILARIAMTEEKQDETGFLIGRFLSLCHENGIYEYFRIRKVYDPILEFADKRGIMPEIVKEMREFSGYKAKKAYIKTFGGFFVYPYADRTSPLKIARKKERELLAFLLDTGETGVTKDQICDAVWPESESKDVKRMARVHLAQIKKDLASLGIEDCTVYNGKMCSICRDEIECDFELFENAAERFRNSGSSKDRQTLMHLYTGEYLSDFEAFWAMPGRIKYSSIYNEAIKDRDDR